jgi:hypothetical protein
LNKSPPSWFHYTDLIFSLSSGSEIELHSYTRNVQTINYFIHTNEVQCHYKFKCALFCQAKYNYLSKLNPTHWCLCLALPNPTVIRKWKRLFMSGCDCRSGLVLSRAKMEQKHQWAWGIGWKIMMFQWEEWD